jgi:adenine deaminase
VFEITGNIVDVMAERTYPGVVRVNGGRIVAIEEKSGKCGTFIMPGFVDAHVHIESSMLTPSHFAAAAVVHGTVATVSDPHEIANVLGVEGVQYMLRDAAKVPFKFLFGAPSCVPATNFETAGAAIDVEQTKALLADPRIGYLSEMMNWPGVLRRDPSVMAKIAAAKAAGKPVDGHAPGLRGADAATYLAAGIQTDHECFTLEEALDKLSAGAKILIREGSAARNLEALWTLIDSHPGRVMLCSDDKHPNDLVRGHINELCARLVAKGANLHHILRAACIVPVEHYRLPVGLMRVGDEADFVEVNDLRDFKVNRTWIDGVLVAREGRSTLASARPVVVNRIDCRKTSPVDFHVGARPGKLNVIVVDDGQIVTRREKVDACVERTDGKEWAVTDSSRDLLKIAVINRFHPAPPAVAFIRGFGLAHGAIAGSVAHDSHNIIAVGVDDDSISAAANVVIDSGGGLCAAAHGRVLGLALPIAGLMSAEDCATVAAEYEKLEAAAKELGSTLRSPFMTLSFMALLVIPSLKLGDRGLFDGERFEFAELFS